jgi:alanine racemase
MAVVKADGYGHEVVTVARAAVAAGAGWLGTTSVAEASALRAEGWRCRSSPGCPLRDRRRGGGSHPDRRRGRVGGRARRARRARRVDGAGSSPCGHRDVPRRLPPRAVGQAHRSRSAWSTGSEGPRRGCHGASSSGRPGRSRGQRAGGCGHARGATGGPGGGARLTACPPCGHVGDGDRPGDTSRHGPRRGGTGRHRSSGTVELHGASRLTAPIVHTTAVEAGTPVGYAGMSVTDRATHLSVLPVGEQLVARLVDGPTVPGSRMSAICRAA